MNDYVISPEAFEDLQRISDYIAADNDQAAECVIDQLFEAFEQLARFPGQGHFRPDLIGRRVRFWSVYSYLVIYREDQPGIQIVAVLHGARDIAAILGKR